MKVMLLDQISSVTWKYTFSLGNALIAEGNAVIIVGDRDTIQHNYKGEFLGIFNIADKTASKVNKLKSYIADYKAIIKRVRKEEIDVVHMQWTSFTPVDLYFIKKLKKITKVVFTVHDIVDFDVHFYDKHYLNKIYKEADAIFLQTEDNVALFSKVFPKISKDKIHLAYHGHFLEFASPKDKDVAREKLSIPSDKFVYMFFGQIKKVKGVDLLIKAFNEIQKERQDVCLVIAGNVWKNDFNAYQQLIDGFKLNDKVKTDVRFIPDELVDYYFSAADVMCLPYTELYQSGVVQLCYAYRKAAIVSDLPAFLTVVENEKSGFVFKSGDYQDLALKMEKAYSKKRELANMANTGYNFIANKYSWTKIAHIINDVYNEIKKA